VIALTVCQYLSNHSREPRTKAQSTTFNRAHHRFVLFAACCTFLLLIAGALVTSNDAGLSVPDWPTSFGSLYRIPPLIGGRLFEHGHRMVAQFIGFLTIIVAIWTQRVDRRPWMKAMGWAALGTVIAQGILGGLTVLFQLPPAISTAHATLAQTFFCILVSMTLFTSRGWIEGSHESIADERSASLATRASIAVGCVWLQLILGAAFRHSGLKLIPHLIGACVVVFMLLWTTIPVLKRYSNIPDLRRPAISVISLLGLQLVLGLSSYLTRVVWSQGAPEPELALVVSTVSHVAVGALVLASTVVLAIQANRYLAVRSAVPTAAHDEAIPA
jgi:heme a synthase